MKFAVAGAGAIGAYLGAMLQREGEDVFLIARGPHLQAMREHGLRHVPVLEDGKLAGLIGERDVMVVRSLRSVSPESLEVGAVMKARPHAVAPDTPLPEVAAHLAESQDDSVVVVKGDCVIGLFTTLDALRAIQDLLVEPVSGQI